MRMRRRQEAEERAGKVGVKLVFPIFFFILPSMLIVAAGPGILQIFKYLFPMMNRDSLTEGATANVTTVVQNGIWRAEGHFRRNGGMVMNSASSMQVSDLGGGAAVVLLRLLRRRRARQSDGTD